MFGKNSSQYIEWVNHADELNHMPDNVMVVNTGSTPSYHAFDYTLWHEKGVNLAFPPQPLYYDFETLKKYSTHFKTGAVVLISIEEFKFLVDAYADEKTDHKYYLWLEKDQIRTYKGNTKFLIRHIPCVLHPRFVLHDLKQAVLRRGGSSDTKMSELKQNTLEKHDAQCAEKYFRGWEKEFGWEARGCLSSDQKDNIKINYSRLEEMVDYCNGRCWHPYIVVLPFSPNLTRLLPGDILDECLWQPLEKIKTDRKIEIINLYFDPQFADYRLYKDALSFNDMGRILFNNVIQGRIELPREEFSMEEKKTYTLRNGIEIPWISFGTGVIRRYTRNKLLFIKLNLMNVLRSVKHMKLNREIYGNLHIKRILTDAYDSGFRMFDSGRIYAHSEDIIGGTVAKHVDALVTTKVSEMDITRAASPNDVAGNLAVSLKNIGRDHADLYMLHWPEGDWLDYYSQIIDEYKQGKCRAFGACNLEIEHLKQIEDAGLELPMVMQTEMHPLCARKELRLYCQEHGIQVMAHTATGHNLSELRESEIMKSLMKKYCKSCAQVVIRWHYQNGVIPVVSTFHKEHMEENLDVFDFQLTREEMDAIDALDCNRILLNSHGIDDPNYIYNY